MSTGNFSNFQNNFCVFGEFAFLVNVNAAGNLALGGVANLALGLFVFDEFNNHFLFSNFEFVVSGYDYDSSPDVPVFVLSASPSTFLALFAALACLSFSISFCCLSNLLFSAMLVNIVSFILLLYHIFRKCQGVKSFFLKLAGCTISPLSGLIS